MCTEDIVFLPQGSEPVVGPDAIRAWGDEQPPIKTMTWSVDQLEQEGDMAWLRGPVSQTLDVEGEEEEFDGKFSDVLKRGDDGQWRFAMIMWSSNHEE